MAFDTQSSLSILSRDELASLEQLCAGEGCDEIPDDHAKRLMSLGLVELAGGGLEPLGHARVYLRCFKAAA